ncbi:hypothetical protein C0J52_25893 [Blattella germanica]|nr:hypothetical protein C0J52_25893 [Blattella germanica]
MKLEMEDMKNENVKYKKENYKLKGKITDLEQYTCKENLIIHGIPETKNEDIYELLNQISSTIGSSEYNDYSIAHRLPNKKKDGCSPILVRFFIRTSKDAWFHQYKEKVKKENNDTGLPLNLFMQESKNGCFSITEHLTTTRDLLNKTREVAKSRNLKFVWVKDNKIFIRANETSQVRRITSEYDLNI